MKTTNNEAIETTRNARSYLRRSALADAASPGLAAFWAGSAGASVAASYASGAFEVVVAEEPCSCQATGLPEGKHFTWCREHVAR